MNPDHLVLALRAGRGPASCWSCGEYGCNPFPNCECRCHHWAQLVQEAADLIEKMQRTTKDACTLAGYMYMCLDSRYGADVGASEDVGRALDDYREFRKKVQV